MAIELSLSWQHLSEMATYQSGASVFAPSIQNAIVYLLLINLFILRRIIPNFVPGIYALHIKRQQFLPERTVPVRKMTPLLPQVLPPTSLGQPSSCEKGGVRLLRKERQLQRSGGRKGLSYQACKQGESFHP